MSNLSNMPASGVIVIAVTVTLFILAVFMLFGVCASYRRLSRLVSDNQTSGNEFLRYASGEFAAAYKRGVERHAHTAERGHQPAADAVQHAQPF